MGFRDLKNEARATCGGKRFDETVKHRLRLSRGSLHIQLNLKTPDFLELQQPQSSPPHHDEMLFILVHQTYELWFKELLHDLDAVVANLKKAGAAPQSRDEVYEAARLLRRCTEITRVLVEQFTILETMLPTHFPAFSRPAGNLPADFNPNSFARLVFYAA